ncbi:hypothetical protein RUM43_000761 [Polyplax serrata]|uniref:Anaphase-promoting complex subunit 4-like WD40 domain-containing protein n=1 Tax=Polyplax serrata TaxID=468196 RepID=A0AAN8SED5_POLSC
MGKADVLAHNVRFYNPESRAIHCMALQRKNKKLAVSRSDNSVEIWDVNFTPYLEKSFSDLNFSIEDVKWFGSRLFSCGLQGYIVEYDCLNESVLYTTPVTGGPAWCIDVNEKRRLLACGTEDGYINILEIGNDKLEHYKFLDKQQGRILCLSWDKSGQHLVTGSVDVIRVWNVETGHAIHKMKTGRNENRKETVVWCVAVTSDFTIISGDSRGCLCFWDGKIGTQIESNNTHDADILSLALTEDESAVYCAGKYQCVDPTITIYGKVAEHSGGRRKWAKGGQRKIHEHDVRALAISSDKKLFTGGIDGYLALSSYPPKVLIKFPPLLKGPCTSLAPSKRYVLLRYLTYLDLWKLGQAQVDQETFDSFIPLDENEMLLLKLKAKKTDTIISSSLSDDGQFLAYSTNRGISFFRFSPDETVDKLTKLPEPTECGPCRLIQFYQMKRKNYCAAVTKTNEIHILEMGDTGPDIIQTIKPAENETLTDTISHLTIMSDTPYLVAADCQSNIGVWMISNWSLHCTLPKYSAAVTAVSMRKGSALVVVAYSDLKVVEFDLKEKKYTQFSKNLDCILSNHLHTTIASITFDSRKISSIIVHDDSSICVFDKNNVSGKNEAKQQKLENEVEKKKKQHVNVIKKSKHIVSLTWLEGEEMVIVSVNPLKLAENLPPSLEKKLFGT